MMKRFVKKLVLPVFIVSSILNADSRTTSYYSIRSQSVNVARELAGWTEHVNLFDIGTTYGSFSFTPEYTQSFRHKKITACFFGDDLVQCDGSAATKDCDGDSIVISGSRVTDRGANDWLADNFYLPTDFKSTIRFKPVIQNFIANLNFFFGLDKLIEGMFIKVHVPVAWTKWDLGFCETISASGSNPSDAGYLGFTDVPRDSLLKSFTEYARGKTITAGGVVFDALRSGQMSPCSDSEVALADLRFAIGFTLLNRERGHLGFSLLFAAPTGTRATGGSLFEPIVGNGHHWEVGAGLTLHGILSHNEEKDRSFGFYADVNVTHLFGTRQKRFFDLKKKGNSRYMLAAKFGANAAIPDGVAGDPDGGADPGAAATPANFQFANLLSPVANLTSMDVKVSIGAQVDAAAMFNFACGGFNWDVGYNLWFRSCEKLCVGCCPSLLASEKDTWALKGDAYLIGFATNSGDAGELDGLANNAPIRLSATQSTATIHKGNNFSAGLSDDDARRNPNIDLPQFAYAGNTPNAALNAQPNQADDAGDQTRTSIQPVFLSCEDIEIQGSRLKGLSHKAFTHFSYNWVKRSCCCIPYVGVGGEVEFGRNDKKDDCPVPEGCETQCPDCIRCSLSQWGVWIKTGVSF